MSKHIETSDIQKKRNLLMKMNKHPLHFRLSIQNTQTIRQAFAFASANRITDIIFVTLSITQMFKFRKGSYFEGPISFTIITAIAVLGTYISNFIVITNQKIFYLFLSLNGIIWLISVTALLISQRKTRGIRNKIQNAEKTRQENKEHTNIEKEKTFTSLLPISFGWIFIAATIYVFLLFLAQNMGQSEAMRKEIFLESDKYENYALVAVKEDHDNDEIEDASNDSFIQETIDWIDTSYSSCEKFDPYNCKMGSNLLKPSKVIENYIGTNDVNPIVYCTNEMSECPIKSQYWYYANNEGQMYNLSCNGDMIFIDKEVLENYIESQPTIVLVMQVTIEFEDGYYRYLTSKYKSNMRSIVYTFNNELIESYEIKIKNYRE